MPLDILHRAASCRNMPVNFTLDLMSPPSPNKLPEYLVKAAREHLIQERRATAKWLLDDNLEELRLFQTTLEDFVEAEEKRDIEALAPFATTPDFWMYNHPYQWQDIIGSQLRQSFVMSLASATEFHLGLLCRDTASVLQSPISHEDLKGGLITRARKFVLAFGRFNSPPETTWQNLADFYVLRNTIAHGGALVDTDREGKRLVAFMQRNPGISVPSAGMLKIERQFTSHMLDVVQRFFEELHGEFIALCVRVERDEV